MNFWFVNQGTSFKEELEGKFIYAPKNNENGLTLDHWSNVEKVKKDDVIFCNKKGVIKAIGIAKSNGYESSIPESIQGKWNQIGFKVDVEYHELSKPFRYNDYKDKYLPNLDFKKNPFTKKGLAKMGYLFPMEEHIVELFLKKINDKNVKEIIYTHINEKTNKIEELEEIEEEQEQFEEISRGLIKGYSKKELEEIEKQVFTYENNHNKNGKKITRVKTDPKLKATRMELANYNCEIDCSHKTFTCASGKHQYLECHHIIPLNAQKDFIHTKLDSLFNIIAVCPLCHRKVHYAIKEEKKKIFIEMYEKRKDEMLKHGFDLDKITKIFDKYYLNKKED